MRWLPWAAPLIGCPRCTYHGTGPCPHGYALCVSLYTPSCFSLSLSLSLQPFLFTTLARCIPCSLRVFLARSLSLSFFLSLARSLYNPYCASPALSVSTSPALSVSTSPALSVSLSVSTHGNMCAPFYGKTFSFGQEVSCFMVAISRLIRKYSCRGLIVLSLNTAL